MSRRWRTAFVTVLVAGALSGCSGSTGSTVRPLEGEVIRQEPVAATLVEPVVPEGVDGLEVVWWITEDADGRVARVLGASPPAEDFLNGEASRRWRENGLRMVRVPVEALGDLMAQTPPRGQLSRQWIGWSPRWREFFRGRSVGGVTPLLVDGGRVSLAAGEARLIGRAWRGPGVADDGAGLERRGVFFVELAVQVHEEPQVDAASFFLEPRMEPEENLGAIIDGLAVRGVMDPQCAYVIVGENPRVSWDESKATVESPTDSAARPGPATAPLRTIGESMLTGSAVETRGSPVRVMVVLLPRLETEFTILPRRSAAPVTGATAGAGEWR